MVKAVYMVDNSGSTSCSIISCLGPEIFVHINRILTKFCPMKVRGSGNFDTPCTYTHQRDMAPTREHTRTHNIQADIMNKCASMYCIVFVCKLKSQIPLRCLWLECGSLAGRWQVADQLANHLASWFAR